MRKAPTKVGAFLAGEHLRAERGWWLGGNPQPGGLPGSVTRKCIVSKCRGGHWPPGRICCEFADTTGEYETSCCRASNARPYIPVGRLFEKLEFGGESPLTMRARCAVFRHCPNPLGIVTAEQLDKLDLIVLQLLYLIGNHSHSFGVSINFNGIECLVHRYSCYASLNYIFRTNTSFYIH